MGIHNMGSSSSAPLRTQIPRGVTRIHIAGMQGPFQGMGSPNVGKARRVAELIRTMQPASFETWYYLDNLGYKGFLKEQLLQFDEAERAKQSCNDVAFVKSRATTVAEHHSTPFVWLESSDAEGKRVLTAIGGRDKFDEWARKEFADVPEIAAEAQEGFSFTKDVFFDNSSTTSSEAPTGSSGMALTCSTTAKATAA